MANYKITSHFLPWEIDYCHLMFMQLKKSKYYLSGQDNIEIEMVLNLSDYIIDWSQSQLPKEFFKRKFENLAPLLKDFKFKAKVYEGVGLYGCLDAVRETVEPHIDYYINISPDMYFSEHLLYYMIEFSKTIQNKYFVLTPEIPKMWDYTWDEITNRKYLNDKYEDWNKVDIFDVRNLLKNELGRVLVEPTERSKWAGWFDLYNKAHWEQLVPVLPEWKGYGPHDLYSLIITEKAQRQGVDFQQWVMRNQIIFEYSVGPLKDNGFSKYYKDFIKLRNIPNQRQEFEKKLPEYINKWSI